MLTIFNGPSNNARQEYTIKMVNSGNTNIVKLYLSDAEIDAIINKENKEKYEQ